MPRTYHDYFSRTNADVPYVRELYRLLRPHAKTFLWSVFLILIGRICAIAPPASLRYLADGVTNHKPVSYFVWIVALVTSVTAVEAATTYFQCILLHRAAITLVADLKRRLHWHIVSLPLRTLDRIPTGTMVELVMEDVECVRNLAHNGMINFVSALLGASIAFIVLATMNPVIAAVILAIFVLNTAVTHVLVRRLYPLYTIKFRLAGEIVGRLAECFSGIRVVKAYCREELERELFNANLSPFLDTRLKLVKVSAQIAAVSVFPIGMATVALASIAPFQLVTHGLTLGGFVAFAALLPYLLAPIMQVPEIASDISEAFAGLKRICTVMSEPTEETTPGWIPVNSLRGEVEFRSVHFSYGQERSAVQDISFRAMPGSVTAIVGASGAGKSTISALLMGFYRPESGSIYIDGIDLTCLDLKSYRRQIGVVMQDTFLFGGTLHDNVAIARPEATKAEVEWACTCAGLESFIRNQQHGYGTLIGERGVTLSGGERQRVAIARALLADPRVLILDEATSNLDAECEALILDQIKALIASRTTLMITHRLLSIRKADQILVLDSGRIVERGVHRDLLYAGGVYAALCGRHDNRRILWDVDGAE